MSHVKMIPAPYRLKFARCLEACVCNAKICEAFDLSQCSECKNVQKSQCSKKACKRDGEAPVIGEAPEFELQKTVIIILA